MLSIFYPRSEKPYAYKKNECISFQGDAAEIGPKIYFCPKPTKTAVVLHFIQLKITDLL